MKDSDQSTYEKALSSDPSEEVEEGRKVWAGGVPRHAKNAKPEMVLVIDLFVYLRGASLLVSKLRLYIHTPESLHNGLQRENESSIQASS